MMNNSSNQEILVDRMFPQVLTSNTNNTADKRTKLMNNVGIKRIVG